MATSHTIRILLIDDDQGDFEMTRAMISQIERLAVSVDWVPTFHEGLDAFKEDRYDLFLVDYRLEDRDGLELVRAARELGVRKPIIMLTGRGSHEVDVEAMVAGASDYLVKGRVDPDLLERTIRYALERQRAEEALKEANHAAWLRGGSERFLTIFEASKLAILLVDLNGLVIEANPALRSALGFAKPDPDGQPLANLVLPEERRPVADERKALTDKDSPRIEAERRFLSADGAVLKGRSLSALVTDADGEPDHIMVLIEDLGTARQGAGST